MLNMAMFPTKIDVYAFGVVLYELISAKQAIVRTNEYVPEATGLVALVVFYSLPLLSICGIP